jgi:hypothetical protein
MMLQSRTIKHFGWREFIQLPGVPVAAFLIVMILLCGVHAGAAVSVPIPAAQDTVTGLVEVPVSREVTGHFAAFLPENTEDYAVPQIDAGDMPSTLNLIFASQSQKLNTVDQYTIILRSGNKGLRGRKVRLFYSSSPTGPWLAFGTMKRTGLKGAVSGGIRSSVQHRVYYMAKFNGDTAFKASDSNVVGVSFENVPKKPLLTTMIAYAGNQWPNSATVDSGTVKLLKGSHPLGGRPVTLTLTKREGVNVDVYAYLDTTGTSGSALGKATRLFPTNSPEIWEVTGSFAGTARLAPSGASTVEVIPQ